MPANVRRIMLAVMVVATVIGLAFTAAMAGPMPLPLKAELDLAETVAVGKIVDIVEDKPAEGELVIWGRATVAVTEVLKGKPVKELTLSVATRMMGDAMMAMASPPREYSKGEEGIFVVMAGGRPSHAHGFQEKKRVDDVKAMLADLEKRTWSEEVGGLRVWAGVTQYDWDFKQDMIIFAVKNVSKSVVWLPEPIQDGLVSVVMRDAAGTETNLIAHVQFPRKEPTVRCVALAPGETLYDHPGLINYGAIRIPPDLPPGKHEVRITLTNNREGTVPNHGPRPGETPVDAWKGKVAPPPVMIEIPKAEK
jgi:hypothetical protein